MSAIEPPTWPTLPPPITLANPSGWPKRDSKTTKHLIFPENALSVADAGHCPAKAVVVILVGEKGAFLIVANHPVHPAMPDWHCKAMRNRTAHI